MDKKAQVSVDLIVSLIIAMFFFAFVLKFADSQYEKTEDKILALEARHVAEKLAGELNGQYLAGNGSIKYVTLPQTLYGGKAYSIRVYPGAVLVSYSMGGERDASHKTAVRGINGTQKGLFLEPGRLKLSNIGGVIYVENA